MYQDSLYSLCRQLSEQYSRELMEDDIRKVINHFKLPAVMGEIWSFTGHFYKWPQMLLTRQDLSKQVRSTLEDNLQDELGNRGTPPHTQMFIETAQSMGIILNSAQTPGTFMAQTLETALVLPPSEAIGAFFANESLTKWRGFLKVFSDHPKINMAFFDIHSEETGHSQRLLQGLTEEDIPDFLKGVIGFSKSRAAFMGSVRQRLLEGSPQGRGLNTDSSLSEQLLF